MSSCTHTGPPEVIVKAEVWLREQGIDDNRWSGLVVRHAENTPGGMWESVIIDIERRGDEWIVTNIDRRKVPVDGAEGLSLLQR
jgi:hypothetical protein